jgi:AraC-like DNA-binding protein
MCRPMPTLPRRLELPDAAQLHDLVRLRRVRDRLDREYAQPFDLLTLARDVHMTPGHLSRGFELAYGLSPYTYVTTRRLDRAPSNPSRTIRNREAPATDADLALRS